MNITYSIVDGASKALRLVGREAAQSKSLHTVMGVAVRNLVRERFTAKAATEHNPFGKKSTFWSRMVRSTRSIATPSCATVAMPAEIRLRYMGGTVKPTGDKKALAIPAAAEAYGRRPRSFAGLVLIWPKGHKTGVLMMPRKGSNFGTVYYILTGATHHKADASVLPTAAQIEARAAEKAREYFEMIADRK
jgi:hypothetical protein